MPWSSTTSPLLSFASSEVFSAGASSNIFLKFCGKVNKPTDHRWRILGLLWEIMEKKVIYVLWSFVADKMTFWLLLYKVWKVPNLKTINDCHIWPIGRWPLVIYRILWYCLSAKDLLQIKWPLIKYERRPNLKTFHDCRQHFLVSVVLGNYDEKYAEAEKGIYSYSICYS